MKFLSTPSVRRATHHTFVSYEPMLISIHALREEGDRLRIPAKNAGLRFLSTPSVRRATRLRFCGTRPPYISIHALREEGDRFRRQRWQGGGISIHALREEGDRLRRLGILTLKDFYPRPP